MTTDEQLIERMRSAMIAEVATVDPPADLIARLESGAPSGRRGARLVLGRSWPWGWRPSFSGMVPLVASLSAVAIAIFGISSLGRNAVDLHPTSPVPARTPLSARNLVSRVAVLRRPQTAEDQLPLRLRGRVLMSRSPDQTSEGFPKLTRLVAVEPGGNPRLGPIRVYVDVIDPFNPAVPGHRATPQSIANIAPVMVSGRPATETVGTDVAPGYGNPNEIAGGGDMSTGPPAEVHRGDGIDVGVIPDGVTSVRWVFTRFVDGSARSMTRSPEVINNVAVLPAIPGEGTLTAATWYGEGGRVVSSFNYATALTTVNALGPEYSIDPAQPVAPALQRHFSIFDAISSYDRAGRPLSVVAAGLLGNYQLIQGLGEEINLARARFIPYSSALVNPVNGRRGVLAIPGRYGACLFDGDATGCKASNVAGATLARGLTGRTVGHLPQTVFGLVPDGNRSVTVVLRDGTSVTAPVRHNVYSVTVGMRATTVVYRSAGGRLLHITLPKSL